MRIVFALVFLASACSGISTIIADGERDPKRVLASLLATIQQPAAVSYPSVPKIRVERSSPLKFDIGGVRFKVPLKFTGRKVVSGIEAVTRGIKFTLPISSHFHELDTIRPKASELKAELENPLKAEINGVPVSIKPEYGGSRLGYPVTFSKQGVEVEVPLSSIVEDDGTVVNGGIFPSQVEAKLQAPLKFDIGGLPVAVPLKYSSGKVTGEIELKVRGTVLSLPIRFRPRYFSRFKKGEVGFSPKYHLRRVKGKIEDPLKFTWDAEGTGDESKTRRFPALSVPVSFDIFSVKYPVKFKKGDWNFEIPLIHNFGSSSKDGRRIADFEVVDIEGTSWDLGKYQGRLVLVAEVSSKEDVTELAALQKKYGSSGLQIIAVVSQDLVNDKEVRQWAKSWLSSSISSTFPVISEKPGLILIRDGPSPFLAWLHGSQKKLFGLMTNKFLIGTNGKPVKRFGALSLISYEQAISREMK